MFGRVSLCGIISEYNATDSDTHPSYWWTIMVRRLTIRGFILDDYRANLPEAIESLIAWMQSGQLKTRFLTMQWHCITHNAQVQA